MCCSPYHNSFIVCGTVAGPPTITSAEQISPGTTIRVSWDPPTEGATVTGYRVSYTSSGSPVSTGSQSVGPSVTSTDLTGLVSNDSRTYTISVEAESEHLSGVSGDVDVVLLGEFLYAEKPLYQRLYCITIVMY